MADNPYYHPEKMGLTQIALVEAEIAYEFDMTVAWEHEDGRLFWATDSGCSCPSPFENYRDLSDLTEITTHADLRELHDYLVDQTGRTYNAYKQVDAVEFMATVARKFRERKY